MRNVLRTLAVAAALIGFALGPAAAQTDQR